MGAQASNYCERKPHFTFIWAIENSLELDVNGLFESPRFVVQSIENSIWKIMFKVFFNRRIELAILREDNGANIIQTEFEFSVLGADGSPLRIQRSKKEFKVKDEGSLVLIEDYDEVLSQRRVEFLPNETLTVRCRMWGMGNEASETETCFARTRMGVDRRSFVWPIVGFSSLQPGQKRTHLLNPASYGSPQLILSLSLSERQGKDYLNFHIDQNYATIDHFFICNISLLDCDCRVFHSKKFQFFIQPHIPEVFTYRGFLEKDELLNDESSLLPNDVLSLRCEFKISAEPVFSRIENYRYLNLENLEWIKTEVSDIQLGELGESFTACCPFKKAFEELYEMEDLCDVSLRVGEKSFPAHKSILGARSPVFKAILTQDKREKINKVVDIPDMNVDTLGRLLLYIYKDTVQDLQWESAMDLFKAADKYHLLDLRKRCSFFLKSNLRVSNVCSIILLVYMHEDSDLRKFVENFISIQNNKVFKSEAWKNFRMENFSLALEITERVINFINENPLYDLVGSYADPLMK
ncbi:Speckle-type POZ protein B [Araneus ventricosus]|uniref:Speckle-type POZ protein B n=1 Tax=Araneus ventricosus TaxID=182803 RepID=A0A4Y2LJD9_ARAVE|nr:Speckle-type POZ protein B [Araneus ventricosus]